MNESEMDSDASYMRRALEIARFAEGRTSPNPLVGVVVVKDGRIVGEGWHRKAGTPHAEVHALRQAGELAAGATVYVTLEPCAHYGRTPPCAKALAEAGVRRVVAAMRDPNPLVAGRGVAILEAAGIEVRTGVLEEEARKLNAPFCKWMMTKRPYVALKTAMTLDGKIATHTGESRWISGEASRRLVHKMRDLYDSILVGIGTVLADDPSLTTRLDNGAPGKNPIRVVVDRLARTPLDSKIVTDGLAPTIVAATEAAPPARVAALRAAGAEVLLVKETDGRVDLGALLDTLGERQISSLFVEGGATVNFSFVEARLVDRIYAFIAPKLVGGREAPTPVGGAGFARLDDASALRIAETRIVGGDILIVADVVGREEPSCLRES